MQRYGQFCPVSKACEILGERWTILILRELLMGATRYHELQRTLSHISPTVMSKRLATLQDYGLLVRTTAPGQKRHEYHLTAAGRELGPVVNAIGVWGMRWARGQMADDELDVEHLMVYLCRAVRGDRLPQGRIVLEFHFGDLKRFRDWWIVVNDGESDLCVDAPAHPADVRFVCDVRTMIAVFMGDLTLGEARRQGLLRLTGQSGLLREVGAWLGVSIFAGVERPGAAAADGTGGS